MNRLEIIRTKINCILDDVTDLKRRHEFYIHLYGVSNFAALLALRRGLDHELATVSGLLHDISLLSSGDYEHHCENSADMTNAILLETTMFSVDEIDIITSAIFHHNEIEHEHSAYDEILKDADILHPYFNDMPEPAFPPAIPRLRKIMLELNLTITF